MSTDLSSASLCVQTSQTLGMTRLQTTTPSLSKLGTNRTTTSHPTTLLSQHRIQATTPLRISDPHQHLSHADKVEQGYDIKSASTRTRVLAITL
ncbi:hypothetical protein [Dactylosporangium sp. CA-233914]|uniref:hypothetical protein n=1 Tax=Dactylosporangium sp. CA-233914 TaxID=3239934 RepID=UPI003D903BFE